MNPESKMCQTDTQEEKRTGERKEGERRSRVSFSVKSRGCTGMTGGRTGALVRDDGNRCFRDKLLASAVAAQPRAAAPLVAS